MVRCQVLRIAILLLCLVAVPQANSQVDLTEIYPSRLSPQERGQAVAAPCEASDVYRLTSWSFAVDADTDYSIGESTLVVGPSQLGATWAVVRPDSGEAQIYVRFHPTRLGELFPAGTVTGRGGPEALIWATRNYLWRVRNSFHVGWQPTIPPANTIVVDMDSSDGVRGFFVLDTAAGTTRYIDSLEGAPLPDLVPVDEAGAARIFDTVTSAFEAQYAMFGIRTGVDWPELVSSHRPAALQARSSYHVAAVLAKMLAVLEDLHISVSIGDEFLFVAQRSRFTNVNADGVRASVPDLAPDETGLAWGHTADGFGYVAVGGLQNDALPDAFDAILTELRDAPGLILDLRTNGGGNEMLGRSIAGRFLDRPRVYAGHQFRNGPGLTDLGDVGQRTVEPRGEWQYSGPVVVLHGERTMSSAEAFVLMLRQCLQVVTMGANTAGSSGNPAPVEAGGGVVMNVPRWLALGADGNPFEGVGIVPDIPVEVGPDDLSGETDPVLDRAIAELRERT